MSLSFFALLWLKTLMPSDILEKVTGTTSKFLLNLLGRRIPPLRMTIMSKVDRVLIEAGSYLDSRKQTSLLETSLLLNTSNTTVPKSNKYHPSLEPFFLRRCLVRNKPGIKRIKTQMMGVEIGLNSSIKL